MESRGGVTGRRGKALALGQNGRLGLRGLQWLALRHQLQGRRVCGWRVVSGERAQRFQSRRRREVGVHGERRRPGEMGRVLVGRGSGELRDGGGGRRFDVGHGHGGGGQRLLPRRLCLLQRGGAGQHGLRHLQGRVRVRRGLSLEGHLRLSRRSGQGEGLGRPGVGQQGLGLQAMRGGLGLAVQRGLRRGRRGLALGHAQGLQGRMG